MMFGRIVRRAVLAVLVVATAFAGPACSRGGSGNSPGGSGGSGNVGGTGGRGGSGNTGGSVDIGTGTAFPNGIGPDWKWTTGNVAHTAGPYKPCGIIGTGPVSFGAANPTASEFAAASRAGVVLFYSPVTGKQVRPPYYAAGPVNGVDYSRDGTKLVIAGDAGLDVIRLADGKVLFNGKPFALSTRAAALSPDGTTIAVLGWDGPHDMNVFTLQLIRISDGTSMGTTAVEGRDGVAPQFSPDGKRLVAAGMILSVPGLQTLPPSPLSFSHVSPTYAVLSPDGKMVAEGGHVLEIASGRELKTPMPGQDWFYWSAFSPDGAKYVEVEGNGVIHLWRTADWTTIGTPTPISFPHEGSSDGVDGRFFLSGDGAQLIASGRSFTGDDDPVFQVMNLPDLTSGPLIAEPRVGAQTVLSPDGSLLMGEAGMSTRIWQTADLSPLSRIPDGSTPYGFLGNGLVQVNDELFDPRDGSKLGRFAHWSAISPDGMFAMAQLANSSVIRLADLTTQAVLDTGDLVFPLGYVWAFSRDHRFVAGAGKDSKRNPKVVVFDAMTGAAIATFAGVPPIAITTTSTGAARVAAFVPVESGFVSDVRVWSVPDGKPLFDIKHASAKNYPPDIQATVVPMAFSPDGSLLAAGGTGIRIFQVETGTLRQTLPAHSDAPLSGAYSGVVSLAYSATGQIVSAGWDGTMRLWCSP